MEAFKTKETGRYVRTWQGFSGRRRIVRKLRHCWESVKCLCEGLSTISRCAALGLSAAFATGSASAALTLDENGAILLEDDNIEFLFDTNLNLDANGILNDTDVLVSVIEFNQSNRDSIEATTGQELTGLAAIQIRDIRDIGGEVPQFIIEFGPYAGGLNAVLSRFGGPSVPEGNAGEGALGAFWLGDPNLDISTGSVSAGTVSCDSLVACVAQATDGDLWEVDGFTGPVENGAPTPAGNEFGNGRNFATLNSSVWLASAPAIALGDFDAGLSVLFDGSGLGLGEGPGVGCFPFCAPDGTVDVLLGGSITGGDGLSAGLVDDGAVATSHFDLTKTGVSEPTVVPEPSTLALLAAGLAGMGVVQHRRRKAVRHKSPLSS